MKKVQIHKRTEIIRRLMSYGGYIFYSLFIAIFSLGNSVNAQSENESGGSVLEEIIVTVQRREESILEVPVSVSVFSSDRLEKNRIDDIADYFLKTPNVSFSDGGGNGASRDDRSIYIRGVSNLNSTGGNTNAFGFYVDDFNVGLVTNNPQLQDVERIEVLRGPQGTHFGRNATGGAINIATKKPGPEFEASGFVGYGRFDSKEANAVVNIPIVEDSLFLRGVAYWSDSDGPVKNVNPAGGRQGNRYVNGRISARWLATDRLTIDLKVTRTNEKTGIDPGVATHVLFPETRKIAGPNAITDGLAPFPQNTTRVNNDNPRATDNEFTIVTGHIDYVSDWFKLTSITGYIDGSRNRKGDVDKTSRDIVNIERFLNTESVSQELRLSSIDDDSSIGWVLGGLYAKDKDPARLRVVLGGMNPFGQSSGFIARGSDEARETTSYAIYGEISWQALERLKLTAGGRYSRDSVENKGRVVSFGRPTVYPKTKKSFGDFSPRFTLNYDLTDQQSIYATVSKGYKSGGIQLDPALPTNSFDSETLWNYEIGIKGTLFDGMAFFSAAAFYIDWKNLQVDTSVNVIDNTGTFTAIRGTDNAAKASSKGVEVEIQAKPLDALEISAAAGYLNAKFGDYKNARVADSIVDLTGRGLVGAPKWTLSADAQYNFELGAVRAFIRGEWSYRSRSVPLLYGLIAPQDFPFRVPGYNVWNLRGGIEKGKYKLTAYAENVFNKNYYTGTFDDLFFSGAHVVVHPRTFGIRLSVSTN